MRVLRSGECDGQARDVCVFGVSMPHLRTTFQCPRTAFCATVESIV